MTSVSNISVEGGSCGRYGSSYGDSGRMKVETPVVVAAVNTYTVVVVAVGVHMLVNRGGRN